MLGMNKYKIRMFVKPANAQVISALLAKGFTPSLDGYSYAEERTLGGGATSLSEPEAP